MSSLSVDPLVTYQDDFKKNLDEQFTNIAELQNIQKKLFTDLETLAGSPDITTNAIKDQISDKFAQIDNLTKLRTNIFNTILYQFELSKLVIFRATSLAMIIFLISVNSKCDIRNSLHFSLKIVTQFKSIGIGGFASGSVILVINLSKSS